MFKIPVIKFEEQDITSFAGLIIYQPLLQNLNLKAQLKKCFDHLKVSEIFGQHIIMLLLVFHLLLGFRKLRDLDYYQDDPLVKRLLGLKRLRFRVPYEPTIARPSKKSVNYAGSRLSSG